MNYKLDKISLNTNAVEHLESLNYTLLPSTPEIIRFRLSGAVKEGHTGEDYVEKWGRGEGEGRIEKHRSYASRRVATLSKPTGSAALENGQLACPGARRRVLH